jgi:hypothetical protein
MNAKSGCFPRLVRNTDPLALAHDFALALLLSHRSIHSSINPLIHLPYLLVGMGYTPYGNIPTFRLLPGVRSPANQQ